MRSIRRISTNRWWNNKIIWKLLLFLLFLVFVRISKGSLYKDFYYLISKPFWPGSFQKEVILKNVDQSSFIKLKQLENDNKRLRKILSLQRSSPSETINSAVISRQTGSWWRQVILNKGEKDGVEIGSSVVGIGGLLGIIDNTSLFTSSVRLLTSPKSKVGVWVERTQTHALLVGLGNDYPKLIFYTQNVDIEVGDFVLSSPASTLLPPNIPIGIIQSIDKESKSKTTANLQLIANPQAIDWVQILKITI